MVGTARVSWFSLDKKFGFVSLDGTAADAFLHLSVLKSAGYVSVPAGTSMQVSVETDRGHLRVVEVSNVDTSTALAGEPAPVTRKRRS
jgi:CspA family cold shock protein